MKRFSKAILMSLLALTISACSQPKENPMQGYDGVSDDHVIKGVDFEQTIETLSDGTGILILSYTDCPWCQAIMPIVDEVSRELNLDNVYYLDVTTVPGDEQREEIQTMLDDQLTVENDRIVFYVPDVYAIKDGEVIDHHLGAIEGYMPNSEMTDEQVDELRQIYTSLFQSIE